MKKLLKLVLIGTMATAMIFTSCDNGNKGGGSEPAAKVEALNPADTTSLPALSEGVKPLDTSKFKSEEECKEALITAIAGNLSEDKLQEILATAKFDTVSEQLKTEFEEINFEELSDTYFPFLKGIFDDDDDDDDYGGGIPLANTANPDNTDKLLAFIDGIMESTTAQLDTYLESIDPEKGTGSIDFKVQESLEPLELADGLTFGIPNLLVSTKGSMNDKGIITGNAKAQVKMSVTAAFPEEVKELSGLTSTFEEKFSLSDLKVDMSSIMGAGDPSGNGDLGGLGGMDPDFMAEIMKIQQDFDSGLITKEEYDEAMFEIILTYGGDFGGGDLGGGNLGGGNLGGDDDDGAMLDMIKSGKVNFSVASTAGVTLNIPAEDLGLEGDDVYGVRLILNESISFGASVDDLDTLQELAAGFEDLDDEDDEAILEALKAFDDFLKVTLTVRGYDNSGNMIIELCNAKNIEEVWNFTESSGLANVDFGFDDKK